MGRYFTCKAQDNGHTKRTKYFKFVENKEGELVRSCEFPEWIDDFNIPLSECESCAAFNVSGEWDEREN